jgi:DNA polymerase III epsilon subunit-like protein
MASNVAPHIVAIDCEMIGIGRRSHLARVTIVDFDGRVILDKFVKPPNIPRNNTVKINYRTHVSGVTKAILNTYGQEFSDVQEQVMSILEGKTVLGHGLINDFKALEIPDWRARYHYFDTTEMPFFMKLHKQEGRPDYLQPRKLKYLATEFLGKNIQVEGEPHDSAEDARTVIELYHAFPDKFVATVHAPPDKFVAPVPLPAPAIPVHATSPANIESALKALRNLGYHVSSNRKTIRRRRNNSIK